MVATTWWQVVLAGMLGPVIVELAKISTWRNARRIKSSWSQPMYWVASAAFLLLGGLVALLHGVDPGGVPILRAAHLGASAPLFAAALASSSDPRKKTTANFTAEVVDGSPPSSWQRVAALIRW